jgi:hypothetical protein
MPVVIIKIVCVKVRLRQERAVEARKLEDHLMDEGLSELPIMRGWLAL